MTTSRNLQQTASLLEKFSNAPGISGYESKVREILKKEIKPFADSVRIDAMGNLIAEKKGGKPSIMLAAHMDEIGFMAKYISDEGFIYFVPVGGFFDQALLNQRVIVQTKKQPLFGIIGSKPPHLMKEEERKKVIEIDEMFIDIGAENKKDAEKLGVEVGTPITVDRSFKFLANDLATGKAFDDRAGLVILVEAMKRLQKKKNTPTVYAVGTVQEEVGLKGARTSAFDINPNLAIVTDVTIPGDFPGIEKKESEISIGKGTAITVLEAGGQGVIASEKIIDWLKNTAQKNKIKYQLEVSKGGVTDAAIIQLTRRGIPTGVVSVPARYIHSPVEVLSLQDLESTIQLIVAAVTAADKYF
jgi:putative aminopeptidase FrvX